MFHESDLEARSGPQSPEGDYTPVFDAIAAYGRDKGIPALRMLSIGDQMKIEAACIRARNWCRNVVNEGYGTDSWPPEEQAAAMRWWLNSLKTPPDHPTYIISVWSIEDRIANEGTHPVQMYRAGVFKANSDAQDFERRLLDENPIPPPADAVSIAEAPIPDADKEAIKGFTRAPFTEAAEAAKRKKEQHAALVRAQAAEMLKRATLEDLTVYQAAREGRIP